jgi:hypothetical protein
MFLTVTFAPGMMAAVWSVTLPTICPVVASWAGAGKQSINPTMSAHTNNERHLDWIIDSPF